MKLKIYQKWFLDFGARDVQLPLPKLFLNVSLISLYGSSASFGWDSLDDSYL